MRKHGVWYVGIHNLVSIHELSFIILKSTTINLINVLVSSWEQGVMQSLRVLGESNAAIKIQTCKGLLLRWLLSNIKGFMAFKKVQIGWNKMHHPNFVERR